MRISASTSGFYPAPIRATRNPVAETSGTDAASSVNAATDQTARQLVPVAAPVSNIEAPRDLISAPQRAREANLDTSATVGSVRGRSDLEGLNAVGVARQFSRALGSRSAQYSAPYSAQRGAAQYAQVATQEHRDELVSLLGIDVFA
jgi:hypothetical protein